jgi:hypothetical protein
LEAVRGGRIHPARRGDFVLRAVIASAVPELPRVEPRSKRQLISSNYIIRFTADAYITDNCRVRYDVITNLEIRSRKQRATREYVSFFLLRDGERVGKDTMVSEDFEELRRLGSDDAAA